MKTCERILRNMLVYLAMCMSYRQIYIAELVFISIQKHVWQADTTRLLILSCRTYDRFTSI